MNNVTIFGEGSIKRIPEPSCLTQVIQGGDAKCDFISTKDEVVELIDEGTLFITNFKGELTSESINKALDGTYVIQFANETIKIGNLTFFSEYKSTAYVLPPVLTNITSNKLRTNLDLVHDLGI